MRVGIVVLLLLSFVTPASAAPKTWISAHGGFSTYAMHDVNDEIEVLNLFAEPDNIGEITDGFSFGGSAGVTLANRINAGFGYERLLASSTSENSNFEYDIPANTFRAMAEFFRSSEKGIEWGLGLGVGVLSLDGKVRPTLSGVSSLTGSAPFGELNMKGDLWIGSRFAVSPLVGYRFAKVTDVEFDGARAFKTDGSELTVDYSGPFARIAVKAAFGR